MKQKKLGILIFFVFILNILISYDYGDTIEKDFGIIHYSEAPKSFKINIPEDAKKVEIGVYGKDNTLVNKYGGWNAYMKLNGNYLWRMVGLDSNKVAIIEDYVLNASVEETSGRNKWQDISDLVQRGDNEITFFHYTGGDGIGVKVRIETASSIKETNNSIVEADYNISILSCDLRYFETIIKGKVTKNGRPVANIQIGVEDPLKKMSLIGPITDSYGNFEYRTEAYVDYRSGKCFLFFCGNTQMPYVIAERFTKYERVVESLEDNDVYTGLSDVRQNNVQLYQEIINGTKEVNSLSAYDTRRAKEDILDIMIDSALGEKVSSGMEIVDWAGSFGVCAEGMIASAPTGGVSMVQCAPLGIKLVGEGIDVSTDILVKKGLISGSSANVIDNVSSTAISCISVTDPLDSASCIGEIVSGGLHIVSYELENNDYGQAAVIIKLSKKASNVVDYGLVIIDAIR